MQKHLVIIIWDLDFGGIQTRLADILEELSRKPDQNLQLTLLMKRKFPQRLTFPTHFNLEVKSFSENLYSGKQLQFAGWLLRQLWTIQPTHLLTFSCRFSLLAVIYKKMRGILGKETKVTISEEIFLSTYLKLSEPIFMSWLIRRLYPWADQILVLTQAMQQDMVTSFSLPLKKIQVIPSWFILPRKFSPSQVLPKRYDVIYVGRLASEKRVEWILQLAKLSQRQHKKYTLAIVGDGPTRKLLQALAKKNHLSRLHFLGYQSHKTIQTLLLQSRILVLPSKNEGSPMVVLEAASQKVPSIVTNFLGASEIVSHNSSGIIIENLAEFCHETLILVDSPSKIKMMGNVAYRKLTKDFSEKHLRRFIHLTLS